jgi:hypothetical protein
MEFSHPHTYSDLPSSSSVSTFLKCEDGWRFNLTLHQFHSSAIVWDIIMPYLHVCLPTFISVWLHYSNFTSLTNKLMYCQLHCKLIWTTENFVFFMDVLLWTLKTPKVNCLVDCFWGNRFIMDNFFNIVMTDQRSFRLIVMSTFFIVPDRLDIPSEDCDVLFLDHIRRSGLVISCNILIHNLFCWMGL